jgi:hypothetical protein
MIVFGVYLLLLGFNYLPLLLHAVSIVRSGSALQEIGSELEDQGAAFRKCRRQSLYLLLPMVVPIAAVLQEVERRRALAFKRRPPPRI